MCDRAMLFASYVALCLAICLRMAVTPLLDDTHTVQVAVCLLLSIFLQSRQPSADCGCTTMVFVQTLRPLESSNSAPCIVSIRRNQSLPVHATVAASESDLRPQCSGFIEGPAVYMTVSFCDAAASLRGFMHHGRPGDLRYDAASTAAASPVDVISCRLSVSALIARARPAYPLPSPANRIVLRHEPLLQQTAPRSRVLRIPNVYGPREVRQSELHTLRDDVLLYPDPSAQRKSISLFLTPTPQLTVDMAPRIPCAPALNAPDASGTRPAHSRSNARELRLSSPPPHPATRRTGRTTPRPRTHHSKQHAHDSTRRPMGTSRLTSQGHRTTTPRVVARTRYGRVCRSESGPGCTPRPSHDVGRPMHACKL